MEGEEIIKLEDLKAYLSREIETLRVKKQKLEHFASIVKEIDEKEGVFLKSLLKLEGLNEKMLLCFDGSEAYKGLQAIKQDIEKVKFEYRQKESHLQGEVAKLAFNDEALDRYREDLRSFLYAKTKFVDDLTRRQREVFDEAMSKARDELAIVHRLIDALAKKIEGASKESELKEFLTLSQKRIEEIKIELPLRVEDLEKAYERTVESFKGLYERARSEVLSLKEELRRFAVESRLIEEDEVIALEAIYEITYEMKTKDLEFNVASELLKKKMLGVSDEEAQNILLSLSKKGFLALKLIVD